MVCRSKSGGAHIYFFFTEFMSAGEFRDKASEIAAYVGYGGVKFSEAGAGSARAWRRW